MKGVCGDMTIIERYWAFDPVLNLSFWHEKPLEELKVVGIKPGYVTTENGIRAENSLMMRTVYYG